MDLRACYRLLELDPAASDQELKRAYRDLTKVWHPDRFGQDVALRRKAEEKLKAINEAFETIHASRRRSDGEPAAAQESAGEDRAIEEARRRSRRLLYGVSCAAMAVFILLRRPSPAGLVIAAFLFVISSILILRMR